MTYAAIEESRQDGSPILLFYFSQGSQEWRYNNTAIIRTYLSNTWLPSSIEMGHINQTNQIAKDSVDLIFPRDHEFSQLFFGYPPEEITTVTIFRGHLEDPDDEYILYWKGRVSGIKPEGQKLTLNCEPVFSSLRRPGLRARFQKGCRHALYSSGCGIDKSLHVVAGACTSVSGVNVIVPEAAAYSDGWFTGGMFEMPTGALRYIVNHVGSALELIRPMKNLDVELAKAGYGQNYGEYYGGLPVNIYPGCDHSRITCNDKFSNVYNYGGFPWIPGKNPFVFTSIV